MADKGIEFYSEDCDFSLPNEVHNKDWIRRSIENEKCKLGELSIIFCSDNYLLKINQDYLNHDYFTDIITFDYREEDVISGDLFISVDRVKDNALIRSQEFNTEIDRVIIHGVLHILGYNDKTPEEESIIRSKEDFYLSLRSI